MSYQKWTLVIERHMDGYLILKSRSHLTAAEVMTISYEEQALPGEVLITKRPYAHGDVDESFVSRCAKDPIETKRTQAHHTSQG